MGFPNKQLIAYLEMICEDKDVQYQRGLIQMEGVCVVDGSLGCIIFPFPLNQFNI